MRRRTAPGRTTGGNGGHSSVRGESRAGCDSNASVGHGRLPAGCLLWPRAATLSLSLQPANATSSIFVHAGVPTSAIHTSFIFVSAPMAVWSKNTTTGSSLKRMSGTGCSPRSARRSANTRTICGCQQPTIYRREITAAEFARVSRAVRMLKATQRQWHLIFYNCNDFAIEIAEALGLRRPPSSDAARRLG